MPKHASIMRLHLSGISSEEIGERLEMKTHRVNSLINESKKYLAGPPLKWSVLHRSRIDHPYIEGKMRKRVV